MTARIRRIPRTVGAIVAAVCASLVLVGCGSFGTPDGYLVEAKVPRTFNLFPGSPVMALGVDVGIISDLEFEEGDDFVTARMRIDHDTQLPEDVRAVVLTDALLGERFIQLDPPYEGGETFPAGETIEEPANTPAEFDELLNALHEFIDGMQGGDLPRLVDNREELGTVVQDFAELSRVLADQRAPLDRALSSLARLADETGRLLDTNRELIEEDVATLTRVGQTAARNIDQLSATFLNAAELFRHAERALERDPHKWLPLVNNTDDFLQYAMDTVIARIAGGFLCEREGVPTEVCQELAGLLEEVPLDQICIDGFISCEPSDNGDDPLPLGQAIEDTLVAGSQDMGDDEQEQEDVDRVVKGIVDGLGGMGSSSSTGSGASETEDEEQGPGLLDGLTGGGS